MDYTTETTTVLTIQPYSNIRVGMIVRIGNEDKTVISFGGSDTELVLDSAFTVAPTAGTPYTIYTAFNGISLGEDQSIVYDRINDKDLYIPTDSTQVIHWHPHRAFSGRIFEKLDIDIPSQAVWASYEGRGFTYKVITSYPQSEDIYNGSPQPAIAKRPNITTYSDFAIVSEIESYSSSLKEITLTYNEDIYDLIHDDEEGVISSSTIQVGTECALITSATITAGNTSLVLGVDRPITTPSEGEMCVVYDNEYLYTLDDSYTLDNSDILVDNDLANKYWWRITVTPNDIEFEKTVPFIESEV